MDELDYQIHLQHLGTALTVYTIFTSFIFTVSTMLLIELENVASLVSQTTLLVLLVTFQLAMLHLGVLQARESLLTWQAAKSKTGPPSPGSGIANYLGITYLFLWSASTPLMFLCRGLLHLSLISIAIVGASFLAYVTRIWIPLMKLRRSQDLPLSLTRVHACLVFAGVFLIAVGYLVTLNPWIVDESYGFICIVGGGLLILAGILLPLMQGMREPRS